MLAAFGPHEAPVLAGVPGLAAGETVFILLRQLAARLEPSGQAETFKRAREERGQRDIEAIVDEYLMRIEDTVHQGRLRDGGRAPRAVS